MLRTSILKTFLSRCARTTSKTTSVSLHNDLQSSALPPEVGRKPVDGFRKFQRSWNESMDQAKKVGDYDFNLAQKMTKDNALNEFMDYDGLRNNASFQELVKHFLRTYNFQLTGLVTIIFTKLFLVSTQYWPVEIIGKPRTLLQVEADIRKIAECYDMISYGYYFHDLIDPQLSSKPSLRNMLILIGDYFLVKSSYDVASFKQIELYKIYVQTIQKVSEGESLGLSNKGFDVSLLKNRDLSGADVKDLDDTEDKKMERFKDNSENVKLLIEYCYLTGGHLFASSLQSAFKLANFSPKTQRLAFEFGKNFGIAIKMSSQLSAVCLHRRGVASFDSAHTDHLNLSYFAKFKDVPVDIMQELVGEYVARSRKLLLTFCDSSSDEERATSGMIPETSLPVEGSSLVESIQEVPDSEQAMLLLQTLKSILNEIQDFNHDNVQQYHNK